MLLASLISFLSHCKFDIKTLNTSTIYLINGKPCQSILIWLSDTWFHTNSRNATFERHRKTLDLLRSSLQFVTICNQ